MSNFLFKKFIQKMSKISCGKFKINRGFAWPKIFLKKLIHFFKVQYIWCAHYSTKSKALSHILFLRKMLDLWEWIAPNTVSRFTVPFFQELSLSLVLFKVCYNYIYNRILSSRNKSETGRKLHNEMISIFGQKVALEFPSPVSLPTADKNLRLNFFLIYFCYVVRYNDI